VTKTCNLRDTKSQILQFWYIAYKVNVIESHNILKSLNSYLP